MVSGVLDILKTFSRKGLHLKLLELVPYGLHYCTQHKEPSMLSIQKAPPNTGEATAAAVAVAQTLATSLAAGLCHRVQL